MPKKMRVREPAWIFHDLFKEFLQADKEFVIETPDPVPTPFAEELIAQHYPLRAAVSTN